MGGRADASRCGEGIDEIMYVARGQQRLVEPHPKCCRDRDHERRNVDRRRLVGDAAVKRVANGHARWRTQRDRDRGPVRAWGRLDLQPRVARGLDALQVIPDRVKQGRGNRQTIRLGEQAFHSRAVRRIAVPKKISRAGVVQHSIVVVVLEETNR